MKINIKLKHKLKRKDISENSKEVDVKEYKMDTETMSAKLTTNDDNIIKMEVGEKRRRTGSIKKEKTHGKIVKYINSFIKNENKLPHKYYTLFLAMTILAIASTILVVRNYRFNDLEDFLTYSLDGESVIQASSNIDLSDTASEAVLKKQVSSVSTTANVSKASETEVIQKLVFIKPMDGEILKVFSPDKVVYSKTLELWKTHDGIDIKGTTGQKVVSIEKGRVEKVYEDSFLGITVVIDHGQGYKSSYSNLSENVPVKQGEIITKGKIIGQISDTSIGEIKDEPHLHFMLMKDNKIVDPTYIMKNN